MRASSRLTAEEQSLVFAGYGFKVFACFAAVLITRYLYGDGDMFFYMREGERLAELLATRSGAFGNQLFRLIFQLGYDIPGFGRGAGNPTSTMKGISAAVHLVVSPAVWTCAFLATLWAFSGQFALYMSLREALPTTYARAAALGCFFLPSAVYWSSAFLKETFAIGGLGWLVFGFATLREQKRLSLGSLFGLLIGGWVVSLVKPYILFAAVGGLALWLFVSRRQSRTGALVVLSVPQLAIGALAALVAVVLMGRVFPEFAVAEVASEAERLQEVGATVRGGSNYQLPSSGAGGGVSLATAPLGLFTSLFRPLVFEVRNALMAVNAVETTVLIYLVFRALFVTGIRRTVVVLFSHPVLIFAAAFTVVFGTAVGLASTNLGTLSRYRAPMMPLYFLLTYILAYPVQERVASRAVDSSGRRRPKYRRRPLAPRRRPRTARASEGRSPMSSS